MGLPVYRERSPVVPSPQTKLPVVCPYASAGVGNADPRRDDPHRQPQANVWARQSQALEDPSRLPDGQPSEVHSAPNSNPTGVPGSLFWRSGPRQLASRERNDRSATESDQRGTAASFGRYTQRLVRSQPGSREYDDEMRAAELVDMYFQELYRFSRVRQQEPASQLQPI